MKSTKTAIFFWGGNRTFRMSDTGAPAGVFRHTLSAMALILSLVLSLLFTLFTLNLHLHLLTVLMTVLVALSLVGLLSVSLSLTITSVAMRPPWYRPSFPSTVLGKTGLPNYWRGCVTDPGVDLGLAFEDVEFGTEDGVTLRGWHVPRSNNNDSNTDSNTDNNTKTTTTNTTKTSRSRPLVGVVCVHGGGRDRRAFLRHTEFFAAEGMSVLLFDFREHGCSDGAGRGFTYGVKEHKDVIAAVKFARERLGFEKVIVLATSVGASASIIATAKLAERKDGAGVDILIAENPLTKPEALVEHWVWKGLEFILGKTYSRAWPLLWLGRLTIFIFLYRIGAIEGLASSAKTAIDSVHSLSAPLMVIHGTADEIVPVSQGIELFEAARDPKELWILEGGHHCMIFDQARDEYCRRVKNFLAKHLK